MVAEKGGPDKGMRERHPFLWGAPCAIVPDNLKSEVTRSDRNEPVINPDFEAFAEHYGCAVVPARVRHPRDKRHWWENAVKLMYRSVYVDLEEWCSMTWSRSTWQSSNLWKSSMRAT